MHCHATLADDCVSTRCALPIGAPSSVLLRDQSIPKKSALMSSTARVPAGSPRCLHCHEPHIHASSVETLLVVLRDIRRCTKSSPNIVLSVKVKQTRRFWVALVACKGPGGVAPHQLRLWGNTSALVAGLEKNFRQKNLRKLKAQAQGQGKV